MDSTSKALLFYWALCTVGVASQNYEWTVIMGSCTTVCGPHGVRPSLVYCKNMMTHSTADSVYCDESEKPDTPDAYACNRRKCPGEWIVGSFTDCSDDVCDGTQTREVHCEQLQENDQGQIRVDDDQCEAEKPDNQRTCSKSCSSPKFFASEKRLVSIPVPPHDVVCTVGEDVRVRRGNVLRIDTVFERMGVPNARVTWTLPNGTSVPLLLEHDRIHVLENGSLVVHNIQLEDEGTYMATAENRVGKDTAETTVFVVHEPLLRVVMTKGNSSGNAGSVGADKTVHAGEPVFLNVKLVHPDGDETFEWTTPKGIVLRPGNQSGKFTVFENGTLKVENVQKNEIGFYKVEVTSMGGSATERTLLNVIEYKWNLKPAGECSETCGTSGVLVRAAECVEKTSERPAPESRCAVAGLKKPPTPPEPCNRVPCTRIESIWEIVGDWEPSPCRSCRDLQTRAIQCVRRTENLLTGVVSRTNVNDTACTGYPKPLAKQICNENLCPVPPKFRLPPTPPMPLRRSPLYNRYDLRQNIVGIQGKTLYIDAVLAQGYPDPNVTWTLQNGVTLEADESLGRFRVFENGTLRIDNVRYGDRGQVETLAINSEGEDRVISPITIYGAPDIHSLKGYRNYKPTDGSYLIARPGDTVAMQCQFFGSPTPKGRWIRNGVPVELGGRFKTDSAGCLIVTNVRIDDSDVYECVAENMIGVDRKSIKLEVEMLERKWVRKYLSCSEDCGGGTRLVTAECRNSVTNVKVNDSECGEISTRPMSKRLSCNTMPCVDGATVRRLLCTGDEASVKPTWTALEWSACSKSCGGGKQRRKARCVNPCTLRKAKRCDVTKRPKRTRRCNISKCYGAEN